MALLEFWGPHGRELRELNGGRITIGRSSKSTIVIDWDYAVSRSHAELECVGGTWVLSDLGSANGTEINGARISGRQALHVGDDIRIGDTNICFRGLSSEPIVSTVGAVRSPELTPKQREVLIELCRPQAGDPHTPCASTDEIAARMFVGEAAIKAHLGALYAKFEIPESKSTRRRALLAQAAWDRGAVRRSDFE